MNRREIAALAGVSTATVSRVLNAPETVAPATRERVQKVIEAVGYRPSEIARSLKTRRTKLIGYLVTEASDQYNEIANGIHSALPADFSLVMALSNHRIDEERAVDKLIGLRVEGIIAIPASSRQSVPNYSCLVNNMPLVLLLRDLVGMDISAALSDNVNGTRLLTRHLIDLGHKDIAFISYKNLADCTDVHQRIEGYKQALASAGIPYDPERVIHAADAGQILQAIISQQPRPTAILSAFGTLAYRVFEVLEKAGLRVPDDISLCCYGDNAVTRAMRPQVTAIRHNPFRIGEAAAQLLLKQIYAKRAGKETCPPERILVPPELVIRDSTAAPRR